MITAVEATLNYAGAIAGRGRLDTVEPARTSLVFAPAEVTISDVRAAPAAPTLDEQGFAFVKHRCAAVRFDEIFAAGLASSAAADAATAAYLQEVAAFLCELTGASEVVPQIAGALVRTSRRATTQSWAGPGDFVHLDYTPRTAAQFLDWTMAGLGRQAPKHSRFIVFQTWRALSKGPQDSALAVCDGGSVPPEDAVVVDAAIGPEDQPGTHFEIRLCRHRAGHRWYYLSAMEPDDLILFKGFDSDHPQAMNAMHSAFDNPLAGPGAEPRRSIEARFFAFFS
jgi:hypothetical protein